MKNYSLLKKIYKIHVSQLNNLSKKNKKLLICFSAIPGAGKTYISRILEDKYKAVRINSDELRKIISFVIKENNNEFEEKREFLLKEYLDWFLNNYKFNNKMIIIDSGLDRKYSKIKKIVKNKKFKLFIIKLIVSKSLAHKRALARNEYKPDNNFNLNINRWIKENNDFAKIKSADIILNSNKSLDLTALYSKLDKTIQTNPHSKSSSRPL